MAKSGFAKQHLRSFIERIERLLEEKEALTADIREVYSEAKGQGFDTKIMRQVIALRKLDTADRQEREAMLDLYKSALGMDGTPLGDFARDRGGNSGTQQNAPEPSNRDVSADGEPYSEAGPQAEASLAGTGSETPAVHDGEREGVSPANVSAGVTAGETAHEFLGDGGVGESLRIGAATEGKTVTSRERPAPESNATPAGAVMAATSGATGGERAALNIPFPAFLDRRTQHHHAHA